MQTITLEVRDDYDEVFNRLLA